MTLTVADGSIPPIGALKVMDTFPGCWLRVLPISGETPTMRSLAHAGVAPHVSAAMAAVTVPSATIRRL